MIIFTPILPWSYIAVGAAGLAVLAILLRGAVDWKRGETTWFTLGGSKRIRAAVILLSILAAGLFATASMNPQWVETFGKSQVHLQVVVDVSDSVMRAEGGWTDVFNRCRRRLASDIDALPDDLRENGTAGILTFRGDTADAGTKISLDKLPDTFNQLDTNTFAAGEGTNIEKGLNEAGKHLEKTGGRGAVLLISDGNQTDGDALTAAKELARQGIPVHVYPVTSRGPALAITAADLPRRTHSEIETHLRGVLMNARPTDETVSITLSRNPQLQDSPGRFGGPVTRTKSFRIPGGQWVRLRWPVVFEDCGLQFVDLTLSPGDGKEPHQRRFYTHVNRPPRLLAIGGDNRWINAVKEESAEIIQTTAREFNPQVHLKNIDAVIISGIPSREFEPTALDEIATAVKNAGMGFMLFNGGHEGAEDETETVLMSYNDTPLEELLPVESGPRAFTPQIPPRNVVILIDTSGSMTGWNIRMAKMIAAHIIQNLLRPQDRLDLITFTTGAGHIVDNTLMDENGKQEALEKLQKISAGGGTDPNAALALVGSQKMNQCGLIFISDGEFSHITYRPDCRVTAFAIGKHSVPPGSPLWLLSDPFPVDNTFDPAGIIIPYFEPEPRVKFFEPGEFFPLSMDRLLPKNQRLPVPPLPLEGAAVSYLKENAVLNGVRPKLTDPILAYSENETGCVGVFTSEIPNLWLNRDDGREAVNAWIFRLISYVARDRYDFQLEDHGDVIDFRISLISKTGRIPLITQLAAEIRFPEEPKTAAVGIALRPDTLSPGTYSGQIRVERTTQARRGILQIREWGPDALDRPQQIPIIIPPKGTVRPAPSAEMYSTGQNRALLTAIAEAGGGVFDPPEGTSFFRGIPETTRGKPLWEFFLAAAVICYLAGIAVGRWNP
jgi:hypothetical protein